MPMATRGRIRDDGIGRDAEKGDSEMSEAIDKILELFVTGAGHTVTIEYMSGENSVLVNIDGTEGGMADGEYDLSSSEALEQAISQTVTRAIVLYESL